MHISESALTRRALLQRLGSGVGSIALAALLERDLAAQPAPMPG
jgi:hypothetical protein